MPRRRRRRTSRLEMLYAVLLIGALLGGSMWLDRRGTPSVGRVTEKHEEVTVHSEPSGGWSRRFQLGVGFATPDQGTMTAAVTVDSARYDRTTVGDTVAIKYFPPLPFLARTADRSTLTVLWDILGGLLGIRLLVRLVAGAVALWIAARLGTAPALLAGIAWAVAAYPMLLTPPTSTMPRSEVTSARVEAVHLVTKSPARSYGRRRRSIGGSAWFRRLAIPYQVVEMRVAVPGTADSVLAGDAVDSGSVAGLTAGAVLEVRQASGDPREARLVQGTRRFVERNRYHVLPGVAVIAVLGTFLAVTASRKRRSRALHDPGRGHEAIRQPLGR
jgi:hypothetical protein